MIISFQSSSEFKSVSDKVGTLGVSFQSSSEFKNSANAGLSFIIILSILFWV